MSNQRKGIGNRRDFLRLVAGGSLACAGCGLLGAAAPGQKSAAAKHKFAVDSHFTFEQLFQFGYERTIELLRGLEGEIGKEKLHAMIKAISEKGAGEGGRQMAKYAPENDLAAFARPMKKPDHFWKHVLTSSIVEDTPTVFEVKIEECLWASTFRKYGAEDLGYLLICHPDFAMARGFNPKMKLRRSQTLMQGHKFCNHRWEMT